MELDNLYTSAKDTTSDINEHMETLYNYAKECTSIAELGVRGIVSTWALIRGLRDSKIKEQAKLHYHGFDLTEIDDSSIERVCFENDILCSGHYGVSDLNVDISKDYYDLTFIDTFHCYPQCLEELRKFAPQTGKYIILHDVAETTDGITSECVRLRYNTQQYNELVEQYGNKYSVKDFETGLLAAVGQFIEENPRWQIFETFHNNNGLMILKYVDFTNE
jgi:hypothetical protein